MHKCTRFEEIFLTASVAKNPEATIVRYWDHVGGESLDLALEASAPFARFVVSTR